MTSIVPIAGTAGPWREWELEAFAEMQRALDQRGLPTDYEHGIADDGVPWISFYDERNRSFLAHIARDPGNYLLICSDRTVERSPVLTRLLEVILHRCRHDPFASDWTMSD